MKARTLLLIRAAASNLETAESLLAEALHDLESKDNIKDKEKEVELLEFG